GTSPTHAHRFSTVIPLPEEISEADWIVVPRSNLEEELGEDLATSLFPNRRYSQIHRSVIRHLREQQTLNFEVVAEFHATSDRELMSEEPVTVNDWRILKNRSIHQYNHTFAVGGRYISESVVANKCQQKGLA